MKRIYKNLAALLVVCCFLFAIQKSSALGFFDIFKIRPPQPVVSVPFDITKKGNKTEIEFRAADRRLYPIGMRFMHRPGDQADRERLRKLSGRLYPDSPEERGIPTPIRVKIFLIKNHQSELVSEEETDPMAFSLDDVSISKKVAFPILEPGIYKVEVESLRDCPELVGEKIELRVTRPKS